MFYFHCIFIIYLILFYLNDFVGWKKQNAISPRLLCYTTVILTFHHCTGSQQSASRGRVLAFYRIAPCLSMTFTADSKRQGLPIIFFSFLVILKIEKCLLLFTANTNILILLYRQMKTDSKSFIFAVSRLP